MVNSEFRLPDHRGGIQGNEPQREVPGPLLLTGRPCSGADEHVALDLAAVDAVLEAELMAASSTSVVPAR